MRPALVTASLATSAVLVLLVLSTVGAMVSFAFLTAVAGVLLARVLHGLFLGDAPVNSR